MNTNIHGMFSSEHTHQQIEPKKNLNLAYCTTSIHLMATLFFSTSLSFVRSFCVLSFFLCLYNMVFRCTNLQRFLAAAHSVQNVIIHSAYIIVCVRRVCRTFELHLPRCLPIACRLCCFIVKRNENDRTITFSTTMNHSLALCLSFYKSCKKWYFRKVWSALVSILWFRVCNYRPASFFFLYFFLPVHTHRKCSMAPANYLHTHSTHTHDQTE